MSDHAHPLFLNENDEPPPEVGFIHIIRWENGGKTHVPKAFTAEELQSLEQIKEMYGGGNYELIARDYNNRISRRIRVNLPGKPKPLSEDEPEDETEENNSRNYSAPVPVPQNPFPIEGIMGMFMHSMTTQMQMQQAQQQQQMQMQMAQAEAARQQAAEQTKMMIAMMTANKGQDMTPILVAMMQNSAEMFKMMLTKGGGMGSSEILEAIQIGTNLVKGAQEGAGAKSGSLEELVATFLAGLQQAKNAPPGGMLPPGMIPGVATQAQPQEQPIPRPRRRVVEVAPQPEQNNFENNGTAGIAEVG